MNNRIVGQLECWSGRINSYFTKVFHSFCTEVEVCTWSDGTMNLQYKSQSCEFSVLKLMHYAIYEI